MKRGPKPLPRKIFNCIDCNTSFSVSYINEKSSKVIKRCKECDYKFKLTQDCINPVNYDEIYNDILSILKNYDYAPSIHEVLQKLKIDSFTTLFRILKSKDQTFKSLLDSLNLKPVGRSKFQHSVYLLIKNKYPDLIQEYYILNRYYIDFYIPSLNLAIECDGQQHTDINNFFNLKSISKGYSPSYVNDEIKESYCINNKIKLIRIPYISIVDMKYINSYLE